MLKNSIIKPFGLSVKIWSWFFRLVYFNWVHDKVFTSFLLEKNLWTYDKLDMLMYGKNILGEVATLKYTVYKN